MQNLNIKYIKGNNIMITGDSKVCKIPWDQTVTLNILHTNLQQSIFLLYFFVIYLK